MCTFLEQQHVEEFRAPVELPRLGRKVIYLTDNKIMFVEFLGQGRIRVLGYKATVETIEMNMVCVKYMGREEYYSLDSGSGVFWLEVE